MSLISMEMLKTHYDPNISMPMSKYAEAIVSVRDETINSVMEIIDEIKEISCPYPNWNDDRALCFGKEGFPTKKICNDCVLKWLNMGDNAEDKTE